MTNADRIRITQSVKDKQWRFVAVAANGEIIAASEGYTSHGSCIQQAQETFPGVKLVEEEKRPDAGGED